MPSQQRSTTCRAIWPGRDTTLCLEVLRAATALRFNERHVATRPTRSSSPQGHPVLIPDFHNPTGSKSRPACRGACLDAQPNCCVPLSSESTEPLMVESVHGCPSPWLAAGAQLRWWGRTSDRWSSSCPSGMPRTRTGSGAVPAGTSRTTIALDVGHSLGPWSPTTPADWSRVSRRRRIHAQCRTRRLGIPVAPGPNRLARARRCWERLLLINGRHDSCLLYTSDAADE